MRGGGHPQLITAELIDLGRRIKRRSEALSKYFYKEIFKNPPQTLKERSNVQMVPFALSAAETKITTAANPNFAKMLLKILRVQVPF